MNTFKKIFKAVVGLTLIFAFVFISVQITKAPSADAAAEGSPSYSIASLSAGVLVTTSSTVVAATSTSRVYLRISNLNGAAIYCNMNTSAAGATSPAVAYQGIAIMASSTYEISPNNYNMYKGPVVCISPSGNASTTVYQR